MTERAQIALEWIGAAVAVVGLCAFFGWLDQRDAQHNARSPDTVISTSSDRHIIAALHECPAASAEYTDTLMLIVHAPASGPLKLAGCARIARRPYQVRR